MKYSANIYTVLYYILYIIPIEMNNYYLFQLNIVGALDMVHTPSNTKSSNKTLEHVEPNPCTC